MPAAESKKDSTTEEDQGGTISVNGSPWDAEKNPIKVDWLPTSINQWFNSLAERANNNGKKISKDPAMIVKAVFSALPMTLFMMLPVFALLLKISFFFKRRLYMEHLIVALHSHAFFDVCRYCFFNCLCTMLPVGVGDKSWLNYPISIAIAL
ncbi:MAG: hypothetical protein HC938_03635, partial [Nitrospira sp.]|nr:hypothetical protein [Nitrospira sp.]